jgi:hypothetical protein
MMNRYFYQPTYEERSEIHFAAYGDIAPEQEDGDFSIMTNGVVVDVGYGDAMHIYDVHGEIISIVYEEVQDDRDLFTQALYFIMVVAHGGDLRELLRKEPLPEAVSDTESTEVSNGAR